MANFTPSQEKAINDRGKDILVSASAGSGKTTVLVERVLRQIVSGVGADQLLVITFTRAAAEEMKTRIKTALFQKVKEEPKNIQLRRELNNIDTANISTIDSFCLDVVRRFYYAIDLDPGFSILTDETQAELLKERALREIESEFLITEDSDFLAFYDNFAGDRDAENSRNLLLDLYNYAMARPDYEKWLDSLPNGYETDDDLVQSPIWQEKIKPYLKQEFLDLMPKITDVLDIYQLTSKELSKLRESFSTFALKLQNYCNLLDQDAPYNDQLTALRECQFTSTRSSKKWDEDLQEIYSSAIEVRDEAKDLVVDTFRKFYACPEDEQIDSLKKGQRLVKTIVHAEKALIKRFNELKRRENLLDYADMEQLAYQILSSDTTNSQLARDFYQNKFKEILVDEYQDINALQESIIQLLKKKGKNNLFMVGDVKQSIYGFRQADPKLFLQKYNKFKDGEDQERIVLAENFRSSKPVTKTVNRIFDSVMTPDFGGIDYKNEGELVFGADYYPSNLPDSSEIIFHKKEQSSKYSEDDDLDVTEIQMVIDRIRQLKEEDFQVYDGGKMRDLEYSDIAVLTRSRSNNLEIMQAFAQADMPLFVNDAKNYFQTFELTVIMSYLRIIDNPDQDIPLVAVLRSPLFNFNERELAKIRINAKGVSFYSALNAYCSRDDGLGQKCRDFLNSLQKLRDFSVGHRISELIWSIYEQTSFLEIVTSLPNGEQRRANLEALYERANSYESAGFKGLYQFITFITRMQKSEKDLAQPLLSKEAGNSVRLMTIHGSKGLEYPVVFYLGLGHRYQTRDLNGNYIITGDELGVTLRKRDYRLDTLVKSVGNINKKRQLLEEESRILYVALTRAKQKLIMVADIDNFDKKVDQWDGELQNGFLPLIDKMKANSPLALIGPSLDFKHHVVYQLSDLTNAFDLSQEEVYVNYESGSFVEKKRADETAKFNLPEERLLENVKKLYDFQYQFKDASQTTAYQAVSEIKKAFNDPDETELENSHLLKSTNRYLQPIDKQPKFLYNSGFTGAEIGTAMHLVLQYYDYHGDSSLEKLQAEIQDLVKKELLTAELAEKLNLDEIQWFVQSDFARPFWEDPDNLYREENFSSLLPARDLFENFSDPNAKILVHGTIDGYYLANNGIILFDYKTDHVNQNKLEESIEELKQKYTGQLRLYQQALDELGKAKVKGKYLILLDCKQIVEVN